VTREGKKWPNLSFETWIHKSNPSFLWLLIPHSHCHAQIPSLYACMCVYECMCVCVCVCPCVCACIQVPVLSAAQAGHPRWKVSVCVSLSQCDWGCLCLR